MLGPTRALKHLGRTSDVFDVTSVVDDVLLDPAARSELSHLAYRLSHDLAAPVRAVDGFAGLLSRRCAGAIDERGERYLEQIELALTHVRELLEATAEYARLDSRPLVFEPVSLDEVVAKAATDLQNVGVPLTDSLSVDSLPTISGDVRALTEACGELLSNAALFASGDSGTVHVHAVDGQEERGLIVSDSGPGIAEAHRERMLLPFERLHARDEAPGLGMGLAKARRIAARHGGRLWLAQNAAGGLDAGLALPVGGEGS